MGVGGEGGALYDAADGEGDPARAAGDRIPGPRAVWGAEGGEVEGVGGEGVGVGLGYAVPVGDVGLPGEDQQAAGRCHD